METLNQQVPHSAVNPNVEILNPNLHFGGVHTIVAIRKRCLCRSVSAMCTCVVFHLGGLKDE